MCKGENSNFQRLFTYGCVCRNISDIWECGSFCERVCVCVIMPVAPRATYVGPGEIEIELEAINLTFRCYQIWFRAEYTIYSLHTLCFSLHSLLLLSFSFFLLSFARSNPQVLVKKWWEALLALLFPSPMLHWLFPLYVNELGCESVIFVDLRYMLHARFQWIHTDVETMTLLPVGNSFVVQRRKEKPQTVTSSPWRFISWASLRSTQRGKSTI